MPLYQIETKIRESVTELDIPMRSLISVGNSLRRSSESIAIVATKELNLGKAAREHLKDVMGKPSIIEGLSLEATKASPEDAAENEERQNEKEGLLDMTERPQ
jgi:hypothetical protein